MRALFALPILGLAGCAGLTDATGITEAQQLCAALKIAESWQVKEAIVDKLTRIGYECLMVTYGDDGEVLSAVPLE